MRYYAIEYDDLERFVTLVFRKCGLHEKESRKAAEVLLYADRKGFTTHGVANLSRIYVHKMLKGEIDPKARLKRVGGGKAVTVFDGDRGLGLLNGDAAMEAAIHGAKEYGVGVAVVRNSSHFGSAGYYSSKALRHQMVGISMTNLGAQAVAPPLGGLVNMLGTNPISVSVPTHDLPPYVLDMSTTVVATGKIKEAARQGKSIPDGWLVDHDGRSVMDPQMYLSGEGHLQFLGGKLETGGNKGYGLALLVDILCGILSGADVGPRPAVLRNHQATSQDINVGHFFLALNVSFFQEASSFESKMDEMLETLLMSPTQSNVEQVVYPGYPEAVNAKSSVLVDRVILESLIDLSDRLEIYLPCYREEEFV